MPRLIDLVVLLTAFATGTLLAAILGADNTGIALGIGQITFAAALAFLLARR